MPVKIDPSWKKVLQEEFGKPYFAQIKEAILKDKAAGKTIYPAGPNIFNAFNTTPFEQVKVVILGQDPYHGAGQAHGLSFSVPKGIKPPPSLKNIYKELHTDVNAVIPEHGDLTKWAKQGVLLLNAMLTVRAGEAGSHQKIGWQQFTNAVIEAIDLHTTGVIFLFWGKFAQQKAESIDVSKHAILTAPHPSPFSAHNGFFGCKHFSQTNKLLNQMGKPPINWQLTL